MEKYDADMEMHDTDDYAVTSEGEARVFGYSPLDLHSEHEIYENMWEAVWDAEETPRPQMFRDLQICAVAGLQCEWCDAPAVGYTRFACDCGCGGREWVCADCG